MKRTTFLLMFTIWANLSFAQSVEAKKLVSEGIALHDKGEYEKAIEKYDKALKVEPENFTAMAEKALTLVSLGRNDEAVSVCKKVIQLSPDNEHLASVYVTYGNALDKSQKSAEAIDIYDEGIRKFPDYYQLQFNKGIAYVTQKEYDDALPCMHKAIVLNPKHAGSHSAIARLLYSKKKKVPALLAICRFFTIEPEGSRAKSNLEILKLIVNGNVEQTGKKSFTINLDSDMLGDTLANGKPKENSFTATELILSFSGVLGADKKGKKNEVEQFANTLETIFASLKETQADNYGFYWDYYVPYFIEMKDKGHVSTFAYLAFASSEEAYVSKWLGSHEEELRSFTLWSMKYKWPEKE